MRMHRKNGYVLGAAMVAAAAGVGTLIYKTVNKKSNDAQDNTNSYTNNYANNHTNNDTNDNNQYENKAGTIEIEEIEDLPGNGYIYGNYRKSNYTNAFSHTSSNANASTNANTNTNNSSNTNYGEDNQMQNNINIDQNVSKVFESEVKKDRNDLSNLWKQDFDATLKESPKSPKKESNTLGTNNTFTSTADENPTTVNSSTPLSYTVGEAMHDALNSKINSNTLNDYSFNKGNAEAINNYYSQYKRN